LDDGLRVLFDDDACLKMSECIVEGGVAEIFVEDGGAEKQCEDESDAERNVNDFEDELIDMGGKMSEDDVVEAIEKQVVSKIESRAEAEKQIMRLQEFYKSPTKKFKQVSGSVNEEVKGSDGLDDSEDSDYMPRDACSSKEDDEAAEILNKYKAFKKKLRKGEMASLDDVVLGNKAPIKFKKILRVKIMILPM